MNAASRMTGVSARSLALAALALIAVTVTPALAAAVAPDGGATAGYVGKTGQGIVVRLGVEHSYGRRFVYRARMRCSDTTTFLDDYFTDIVSVSKPSLPQPRRQQPRGSGDDCHRQAQRHARERDYPDRRALQRHAECAGGHAFESHGHDPV